MFYFFSQYSLYPDERIIGFEVCRFVFIKILINKLFCVLYFKMMPQSELVFNEEAFHIIYLQIVSALLS